MYPQKQEFNVGIAYLLWACGLFGVCGIHRFYLGKTSSGIVWILTAGLCGFGQLIDLLLIPSMVNERNRYLWERAHTDKLLTMMETGQHVELNTVTNRSSKKIEDKSDPMLRLIKAAAANGNVLSIAQAMLATEMPQEEIEQLMQKALRQGIAHVDNDERTGAVRYYFDL
jgi:TM2 domain-containing membrane protein YozV